MLTPQQSADYDWVSRRAVASCMRRLGVDYPAPASKPTEAAAEARHSLMNRRYGITDPAVVSQWGYHMPRPAQPTASASG